MSTHANLYCHYNYWLANKCSYWLPGFVGIFVARVFLGSFSNLAKPSFAPRSRTSSKTKVLSHYKYA